MLQICILLNSRITFALEKKKGNYLRHIVTQNVMLIAKTLDRYLKANKGATNVNLLLVEMNCTRL